MKAKGKRQKAKGDGAARRAPSPLRVDEVNVVRRLLRADEEDAVRRRPRRLILLIFAFCLLPFAFPLLFAANAQDSATASKAGDALVVDGNYASDVFGLGRDVRVRGEVNGVIAFGSIYALVSLFVWNDAWGFLWWLGALALIRQSRNQLLLATCFCYTIVLEWVGTAIGNWHWNAVVPGLGPHSANPPAGVGILYILLDLITVAITAQLIPSAVPSSPGRAGSFGVFAPQDDI